MHWEFPRTMSGFRALIRALLRIPAPRIAREEAIAIARAECERRSWNFDEPIAVHQGLKDYEVVTRADSRGGNVRVSVDAATGRVREAVVAPR
jgi:hypothetical protein